MIVDTLSNLRKYQSLIPHVKEIADFLDSHDPMSLAEGSHDLIDGDLSVKVQRGKGKRQDEAVLEYHRKMIDLQMPLNDTETYGYKPMSAMKADDFDETRDIGFAPHETPECYVTCHPGMFVIFTPDDAHAPMISSSNELKKLIFKIKA